MRENRVRIHLELPPYLSSFHGTADALDIVDFVWMTRHIPRKLLDVLWCGIGDCAQQFPVEKFNQEIVQNEWF